MFISLSLKCDGNVCPFLWFTSIAVKTYSKKWSQALILCIDWQLPIKVLVPATQPSPTAEIFVLFHYGWASGFWARFKVHLNMHHSMVSDCSQLALGDPPVVMAIFTMKIYIPTCAGVDSNKCPFTKESEFTCLCSSGELHLQSASGWPACPLDKRHLQNSKDSVRDTLQPRQPGTARNNRQFQEVRAEFMHQKEGKQSSSWWERFPNTPFLA